MLITDKIYKLIIAGLGCVIIFLLVNTYFAERKFNKLDKEFSDYKQSIVEQQARDTAALNAFKKANDETILKMQQEAITAKAKHDGELNEIKLKYNLAVSDNDRLRDQIRDVDTKWDTYDDTTRQNYARAAANGLEQCLGLAEQYQSLAYGYNSEVVYLRSIFPQVNVDGSMTMYDPVTDTTKVFTGPVEIKTSAKDIRILPPKEQDK